MNLQLFARKGVNTADFAVSENGVIEALSNGQHVLERHVGLSDSDLLARIGSNPKISGASTFTNDLIADNVANAALRDTGNMGKINNWLANGPKGNLPLTFKGSSGNIVGRGVTQGSTIIEDMTNAKIILKSNGSGGYDILTAYPSK